MKLLLSMLIFLFFVNLNANEKIELTKIANNYKSLLEGDKKKKDYYIYTMIERENKSLPIKVDKSITLTKMRFFGKKIEYLYELDIKKKNKEQTQYLIYYLKNNAIEEICRRAPMRVLIHKTNIDLEYVYFYRDGSEAFKFIISEDKCQKRYKWVERMYNTATGNSISL